MALEYTGAVLDILLFPVAVGASVVAVYHNSRPRRPNRANETVLVSYPIVCVGTMFAATGILRIVGSSVASNQRNLVFASRVVELCGRFMGTLAGSGSSRLK